MDFPGNVIFTISMRDYLPEDIPCPICKIKVGDKYKIDHDSDGDFVYFDCCDSRFCASIYNTKFNSNDDFLFKFYKVM